MVRRDGGYKLYLAPQQPAGDFIFPKQNQRYRVVCLKVQVIDPNGDDIVLLSSLSGDGTSLNFFTAPLLDNVSTTISFAHGVTKGIDSAAESFQTVPIPYDWWIEEGQVLALRTDVNNIQLGPLSLTYEEWAP